MTLVYNCTDVCLSEFLFCFKQKTAYEMRISDWSSDVCSSDLMGRMGQSSRRARCRCHQKTQNCSRTTSAPRQCMLTLRSSRLILSPCSRMSDVAADLKSHI